MKHHFFEIWTPEWYHLNQKTIFYHSRWSKKFGCWGCGSGCWGCGSRSRVVQRFANDSKAYHGGERQFWVLPGPKYAHEYFKGQNIIRVLARAFFFEKLTFRTIVSPPAGSWLQAKQPAAGSRAKQHPELYSTRQHCGMCYLYIYPCMHLLCICICTYSYIDYIVISWINS